VKEKKYSWNVLERKVPSNRRQIYTSMLAEEIPDLLVFKPTLIPDPDSLAKEIALDASNQGK
jgi:hypothetical protein